MSLHLATDQSIASQTEFSGKQGTLYAQVANVLRQRVRSGFWAAGDQLPTLTALEQEFGVARVTLRQALTLLEEEGLIWRKRGLGTFVSETGATEWFHLSTSRDDIVASLEGAWSRLIDMDNSDSMPLLSKDDGASASAYHHMRRIHGRGEQAYAVVDMYLETAVYSLAPDRFDNEMIIPVLEELPQVTVGPLRHTLTLGAADREVAQDLDIPIGSPIGILRRVVCDRNGQVIYVGTVNYRGDTVKLEIGPSVSGEQENT